MRVLRWGAFVSWLIVAGLAVGGFAAFSPRPAGQTSSTTGPAVVAEGRGTSTGRILASAFATAAADRSFLTAASTSAGTISIAASDGDPAGGASEPGSAGTAVEAWPSGTECLASWYGPGFEGKLTASGEVFVPSDFTAALHDVAFNTTVKVTRVDTGAVTTVRINDRGPYEWDNGWHRHPTRCIDLSEAAMEALGGIEDGVIAVTITY